MLSIPHPPPIPQWLDEVMTEVTKCYDCEPKIIGTNAINEDADGNGFSDEGWKVALWPAPTMRDGVKVFPDAAVNISDVLEHFEGKADVTWMTADCDETFDLLVVDGKTKNGGHRLILVFNLIAPDDAPALTRIVAENGDDVRWERLDEPPRSTNTAPN